MKALIVDDDIDTVNLLKKYLEKQGLEVIVAYNGLEAFGVLSKSDVRLVITDWVMPEMDGVTLCKKIRSSNIAGYTYIIFLTANDRKEDVIAGMEAGADDYLAKPFSPFELKVHVDAGIRVLSLEQSLLEKNEVIRNDLETAKGLQKSFLPATLPDIPCLEFAALFLPSAYVSGDIYNIFRLDEKHVGLYHVDVMGHGVHSALFGSFINQRLTHDLQPYGLLKIPTETVPNYKINTPYEVARILNEDNLLEKHGSYFTMLYAILNIDTGLVSIYRAGHNLPLIIRANGDSEYIKGGGAPIGLGIPLEESESSEIQLSSGDSFIVFSDGINDCSFAKQTDVSFGLERTQDVLVANRSFSMDESFGKLIYEIKVFHGKDEFDDDVSIVGFRWNGG